MRNLVGIHRSTMRSIHRHSRHALALMILSSATVITPLGTSQTSGATAPAVSLCSVQFSVTALRVSRGIPDNPETFSFPRLIFVNRALAAQSVAAALCALPTMPTGPLSCVFDNGFNYSLSFSAPRVSVTDVRFDPTGCEEVTGLGVARWVEQTQSFIRVLGSAMRLQHVTYVTFAGKLKLSR
jgi:hypothetical protein